MSNQQYNPPKLAILLIKLFAPSRVVDNLIGDLYEEYYLQIKQNNNNTSKANQWFWQQTLQSVFSYSQHYLTRPELLRYFNAIFCIIGVFITLMLTVWLSYADNFNGYSDDFWSNLLSGKIHLALIEPQFWLTLPEYVQQIEGIQFLLSPKSLVFTLVATGGLVYLYKNKYSVLSIITSSIVMLTLPYVGSLIMLGSHSYQPTQVGPVIAVGIYSVLYMLPIVSMILHLKLTGQIKAQVQLS